MYLLQVLIQNLSQYPPSLPPHPHSEGGETEEGPGKLDEPLKFQEGLRLCIVAGARKGTGILAKNNLGPSRDLWHGAGVGSRKIPMVSQREVQRDRMSKLSSGAHTGLSVFSSVSTIRNQRYHIHANLSFAVLVAQVLLLISFPMEPGTVSRC